MGLALHSHGNLDEAVDAYNQAINIKPDFTECLMEKGNSLFDQRKLDQAIDTFKKVILIKPETVDAYNNIGLVLADQENWSRP